MEATLVVSEGANPAVAHDVHAEEVDWEDLDRVITESMLAFPAETTAGNPPLEPRILADGTKEFHITAEITEWEVEPGKFVDAWTYNGMVPGPMIRVVTW